MMVSIELLKSCARLRSCLLIASGIRGTLPIPGFGVITPSRKAALCQDGFRIDGSRSYRSSRNIPLAKLASDLA